MDNMQQQPMRGYTDHLKKTLNGIQKIKIFEKKPNISNRLYPTKTLVTAVMMIKIGKSKIPALITQNTENMISILFANRIKKYLDNECICNVLML